MNGNLNSKIEDRISYVVVKIDVSMFKNFMEWYNNLDEYVKVIRLLKSAFETLFNDIHCLSEYTTNSCYTQVGPFSFYNYWKIKEYGDLLKTIPSRDGYVERGNSERIAASELKVKHENDIKFKIMSFVTIGIYQNTGLINQLKNSIEIVDKERKLFKKLFPSYIKPILGLLVTLFVGYVAYRLAYPNQDAGSKKRFSGGKSIQELINGINKTGLTEDQIKELNQITTDEDLKNFINTHLQELSKEENKQINQMLQTKLKPEEKKIINKDFPGFDLKDGETVFGNLFEGKGGKPLTKRHRKKRQNKKRKSRKSKK